LVPESLALQSAKLKVIVLKTGLFVNKRTRQILPQSEWCSLSVGAVTFALAEVLPG
jgi:hypothetical protein